MGTVSVADDNLWDCARALRPVADYQLNQLSTTAACATWVSGKSSSRPKSMLS